MRGRAVALVGLVLVISLIAAPPAPVLAAGRCSGSSGGVEQRIAAFWECVGSLGVSDLLTAEDLGQWAQNVIARAPGAGLRVVDFRSSTVVMQTALDRASAGIAPLPPKSADVESRIGTFWAKVNALGSCDLLTATDLGQWALNVIDRDPSRRIRVDDFRSSTAGMQTGLDQAGAPCPRFTTPAPTATRPAGGIVVTGRVTRADTGAAVPGAFVTGIANGHIVVGQAVTDGTGRYALAVSRSYADAYYEVMFHVEDESGLARQFWPRSYTPAGATKFDLSRDLTSVDAVLVRGYTVSGSVKKKSAGWPSPFLRVILYDFKTASPQPGDFGPANAGVAGPEGPGPFQITGVAPGSYYLGFSETGIFQMQDWYWWKTGSFASTTKIVVNGDVSGLDIELP